MGQKHFGTDGIRGLVGKELITPEFCLRLSWAIGKVFTRAGRRPHILIGKDTRISGYMLESVLQSGFVSAGADVSLLGPIPTPAIAYLTRTLNADAGVVISASHNPYYDNGIKLFDGKGNKLGDDLEGEIEAMIDQPMICEDSPVWAVPRGSMTLPADMLSSAKTPCLEISVYVVSKLCWIVSWRDLPGWAPGVQRTGC